MRVVGDVQDEPEKQCDMVDDSSDSEPYNDADREQPFTLDDDIDRLCFEMFANHVDSNTTEDCVTQHLVTIRATLGNYLPPEKRARIPKNFYELRAIFKPHMPRLIRIPVCPGEYVSTPGRCDANDQLRVRVRRCQELSLEVCIFTELVHWNTLGVH